MSRLVRLVIFVACCSAIVFAQSSLPVKWEELTAPDFVKAIDKAQGTCLLPFGIIEKHGPHLPMGTDLINARYRSVKAAEQEYAVVFPEYYFGQINEAKHEPGTVSYSARLQLDLLQETAGEMARNGCKKIIVVNGHGGNPDMLRFFAQSQLSAPRDYVVYLVLSPMQAKGGPAMKSQFDMHAGEGETSDVMISRPDLVHLDRAGSQSGADRARVKLPPGVYTPIWWYARFPEHYAGDASPANKELGESNMKAAIDGVVTVIRAVKADQESLQLQQEFYEKAGHPLTTKQ